MLFCQSHWTVSQDSGVWIDRHFLPAVCRYKFNPYHPCCFVAKLFLILGSSQIMSVTEVSTSLPPSPSVVWDIHILRSLLLFVIFCTCLSQMLVYNVQALGRGNVSYILPFFFLLEMTELTRSCVNRTERKRYLDHCVISSWYSEVYKFNNTLWKIYQMYISCNIWKKSHKVSEVLLLESMCAPCQTDVCLTEDPKEQGSCSKTVSPQMSDATLILSQQHGCLKII